MKIEKDKILNKWVVWKIDGSLEIETFKAKTKKECIKFMEENND